MGSNNSTKANMKRLSTFKSWALICLGKTKENDRGEYVYQVWQKICAENKNKIDRHQAVKGATKTAAERFINGTNFVIQHSVS